MKDGYTFVTLDNDMLTTGDALFVDIDSQEVNDIEFVQVDNSCSLDVDYITVDDGMFNDTDIDAYMSDISEADVSIIL
ncbi:MAG: hypothetical protein LBD53_00080 [Tannerella sp.]|jgi:hypothetical protein|nr:hypothetical protein [Tannerella sp.]